jgi:hypothetical protein
MSNKHVFEGSSSIHSCDYEDDTGCMIIKFLSGATHKYPKCPKAEYEALKAAASPGKHFHSKIRKQYKSSAI